MPRAIGGEHISSLERLRRELAMHRPGHNPSDVQMEDVLCDYCAQPWTLSRPMVEGHNGSCICGSCLAVAYQALVLTDLDDRPAAGTTACTLCLETRAEPCFHSPMRDEAWICRRCTKQAAGVLRKDAAAGWTCPTEGSIP